MLLLLFGWGGCFVLFFGEKENESMENCHENSELTKKLALLHREEKILFNLIHVS